MKHPESYLCSRAAFEGSTVTYFQAAAFHITCSFREWETRKETVTRCDGLLCTHVNARQDKTKHLQRSDV